MAMNFASGKNKKMLDKMKMPGEADHQAMMDDMSGPPEGSPEEEGAESPEEEQTEKDNGEDTGGQDLSAISDDDLMAEIRKRGLTAELEKSAGGNEHSSQDNSGQY